ISQATYDSLRQIPLQLAYAHFENDGPAAYFLVAVKRETAAILEEIKQTTGKTYAIEGDGLQITTTLNLELQKMALAAFQSHLSSMQKQLNRQYASGNSLRQLNS